MYHLKTNELALPNTSTNTVDTETNQRTRATTTRTTARKPTMTTYEQKAIELALEGFKLIDLYKLQPDSIQSFVNHYTWHIKETLKKTKKKQLTNKQIEKHFHLVDSCGIGLYEFARAIEDEIKGMQ